MQMHVVCPMASRRTRTQTKSSRTKQTKLRSPVCSKNRVTAETEGEKERLREREIVESERKTERL